MDLGKLQGTTISAQVLNDKVTLLNIHNEHASAQVSLFGGQVLSFRPHRDGRERLYLSKLARLDGSKSIRGGIPVCWPWFGLHKEGSSLPAHGYMRVRQWQLIDLVESVEGTVLVLKAGDTSGAGFTGNAELELHISIGSQLRLELFTRNTGSEPFPLSCALHTYFAVENIMATTLDGLTGTYSDKTRNWAHLETPKPYAFSGETDRIHLVASTTVSIDEPQCNTTVKSGGHDSIVVWNPWSACAGNFPDMEADDYIRMLCVETALTKGFTLAPGRTHLLVQIIS